MSMTDGDSRPPEPDIGEATKCPKCGGSGPLAFFCMHSECPVRDWKESKEGHE